MPTKLPRPDAKLKQLGDDEQQRLFDHVVGLKRHGGRQNDALTWITEQFGVKTSAGALSEFLSWFQARAEARADEARVTAFLDEERNLHPELTDAQLFERGQRAFSLLAIARQDPKAWTAVQKVGIESEGTALARQKFQRETAALFLQWFEDERARKIANGPGTGEEKVEKLGRQMFGDLWE